MSWPVYSTRFIAAAGASGVASFWVPPNTVAVLKKVDCVAPNAESAVFTAYLGGVIVWTAHLSGGRYTDGYQGMMVAYPGQDLSVYQSSGTTGATASGYLLGGSTSTYVPPPQEFRTLEEYLDLVRGEPAGRFAA